jgi:hypothetical protein
MQSCAEADLGHGLVEGFPLRGSNLELHGRRLAGAVGTGEGASTPWTSTTGLVQARELSLGTVSLSALTPLGRYVPKVCL